MKLTGEVPGSGNSSENSRRPAHRLMASGVLPSEKYFAKRIRPLFSADFAPTHGNAASSMNSDSAVCWEIREVRKVEEFWEVGGLASDWGCKVDEKSMWPVCGFDDSRLVNALFLKCRHSGQIPVGYSRRACSPQARHRKAASIAHVFRVSFVHTLSDTPAKNRHASHCSKAF